MPTDGLVNVNSFECSGKYIMEEVVYPETSLIWADRYYYFLILFVVKKINTYILNLCVQVFLAKAI